MARSPREKPPPPTPDIGRSRAKKLPPQPVPDEENRSLWERARDRDDDAINELVRQHESIAEFVARAFEGRGIGFDELLDEAKQGLRMAVFECGPDRADTFRAFANQVVRNHLTDCIRERSFRSRHERGQSAMYKAAQVELSNGLGRPATADETYDRLAWSDTKRSNHAFAEQRRTIARIDKTDDANERPRIEIEAPVPHAHDQRARHASRLEAGIQQLDDLGRRVIMTRFGGPDFPSQKDAAKRLGITEYRERQTEERALRQLERFLDNAETADDSGARSKD